MHILIVNNEFPPVGGGAGRTSYYLARELQALGHQVSVLTAASNVPLDVEIPDSIRLYRVLSWRKSIHEAGKRGIAVFLLCAATRFLQLRITQRFDVVIYFSSIPAGLLSYMAPGIPSIIALRGLDVPGRDDHEFTRIHQLLRPFNVGAWQRADVVTASSKNLAASARAYANDLPIHVLYNAVDTDIFYPGKNRPAYTPFRILVASRLIKLKGIQYLVQAMAQLQSDAFHLTIIGKGDYEGALRELVAKHCLEDRITFAGHQTHDDLPESMRQSDLFVLPSYGDSYASAFLEAMACGLPIIAAESGGARELLIHQKTGWFVPPHDVDALVNAIRTLAGDNELRQHIRKTALEYIQQSSSWRTYAERYVELSELARVRRGTQVKRRESADSQIPKDQ